MLKKTFIFFLFLTALIVFSCNNSENAGEDPDISETIEDKVIKKITSLPEYSEANALIQSMTNGAQSVTAIIEEPNEDHSDYFIQVGFNKETWFESLYFFYVNPNTFEVSIEDIIEGDVVKIETWRLREKERYNK